MKRNVLVLAVCLMALVMMSCATTGTTVTRVDGAAAVDLTGEWSSADVQEASNALIALALTSPRIDTYINDYSRKNSGELPTVIVGRFRNASSERIDTSIISGAMRTAIINSGKLEFVEGGDMREALREERQDQQSNASEATAAALANETGANFMLTGEVNAIVQKLDNQSTRTYYVKATITNLETNRVLWEGQADPIVKMIVQAKHKL
ncbi:MAG: penicillin-binding protein activator LpoB [Treponema sp.]|nr:penicillin-binding protein activator LpoB [Treponema sp.]